MRIEAILHRLSDRNLPSCDSSQLIEDSRLPEDIQPVPGGNATEPRYILLTGATGFLGAYLLRSLLRDTEARVCCLVRDGRDGKAHVRANLESHGIWDEVFADRFDTVDGCLDRPNAGMTLEEYLRLAGSIDAIYHCAAAVNWIYPYRKLSGVNVRGTLELLRLACLAKTKAFHFISSATVCYSTMGPERVDERMNMLPFAGGIHLGYAQTKCVAESLVRKAGERGLPITIYRPTMISGDSKTGRSNLDDFLSRFIKGCIVMGCAPELDWRMDCCPVDFAAESIVKLSRFSSSNPTFHLVNPRGRYWHEFILWINLFGYGVRLIPFRTWLQRLRLAVRLHQHPLRELAPFFCREAPVEPPAYLPQLYEECHSSKISSGFSQREIETVGSPCPPLNAGLLDRYFQSFIKRGFLPAVTRRLTNAYAAPEPCLDAEYFSATLGRKVINAMPSRDNASHSIVTELTSWRFKNASGLFRYRLELASGEILDAMVKRKPLDIEVLDVGEAVARLCSRELGNSYAEFRNGMEYVNCHSRESAIYRQCDSRFRDHSPMLYGASGKTLILEYLSDALLKDSVDDVSTWAPWCVVSALDGLAALHAIWFGRCEDLRHDESLGPTLIEPEMVKLTPFWTVLADNAKPIFESWLGREVSAIQNAAICGLDAQQRLARELPSTLIHNDFNPRNIALRNKAHGLPRLCAYDWEMATIGLPQHDLAELLCFVLPNGVGKPEVCGLIERHRVALERETGLPICREGWTLGFHLALQNLLVNRFAMYAMVHRFQKQKFLVRVMKTWRSLQHMFPSP